MAITNTETYEDWLENALAEDHASGADEWKSTPDTSDFDYRIIQRRYDELAQIRDSGDISRLTYYLNEGIHGNMAGMGAPKLYTRARFGTKQLIDDYASELVGAIDDMARASDADCAREDKIAILRRVSQGFGKTALMLSGAGSLGPFHLGVVVTLFERGLIPKVISGASAGSMVAGIVGTHTDEELGKIFSEDSLSQLFQRAVTDPYVQSPTRPLDQYDVMGLIESMVPDLTFMEAFEKTGRYINISVAPREVMQRSRLLNAITSPNATIREAVLASCAIPGIFPSVTLKARNDNGKKINYISSRRWVDGSISDDLPARRLARLYGVNHYISSQTNPLVLWALQDPADGDSLYGRLAHVYQSATRDWMRAIYPWAMETVRDIYPMNILTRTWFGIMTQEYTADITIMPRQRFYKPAMLLQRLTPEDTLRLIREGERMTWPKLERIRITTAVSRKLDEVLTDLGEPVH